MNYTVKLQPKLKPYKEYSLKELSHLTKRGLIQKLRRSNTIFLEVELLKMSVTKVREIATQSRFYEN